MDLGYFGERERERGGARRDRAAAHHTRVPLALVRFLWLLWFPLVPLVPLAPLAPFVGSFGSGDMATFEMGDDWGGQIKSHRNAGLP